MLLATGAIRWLMFTSRPLCGGLLPSMAISSKGGRARCASTYAWCSTQKLGGRADLDGGKRAYCGRLNSSGISAMLMAMRRASSRAYNWLPK